MKINKIKKKSMISLEVVIIAAICLIVLIILSIIFTSRMGYWNRGLKFCDTVCKATAEECKNENYQVPVYWDNCEDRQGTKFRTPAYCCKEKIGT